MTRNAFGVRTVADIDIDPNAVRYYYDDPAFHIAVAIEKVYEWDYKSDAHGYCHDRSTIWGLLREIERLRGAPLDGE